MQAMASLRTCCPSSCGRTWWGPSCWAHCWAQLIQVGLDAGSWFQAQECADTAGDCGKLMRLFK